MGRLDTSADKPLDEGSYETRELAWELSQARVDDHRIKFLMETGADVRRALQLARLSEKDLAKNPTLRHLHLERHLQAMH